MSLPFETTNTKNILCSVSSLGYTFSSNLALGLTGPVVLGYCRDYHGISVHFNTEIITIPHTRTALNTLIQSTPLSNLASVLPLSVSSPSEYGDPTKSTLLRSFFPMDVTTPQSVSVNQLISTFLSRIPIPAPISRLFSSSPTSIPPSIPLLSHFCSVSIHHIFIKQRQAYSSFTLRESRYNNLTLATARALLHILSSLQSQINPSESSDSNSTSPDTVSTTSTTTTPASTTTTTTTITITPFSSSSTTAAATA